MERFRICSDEKKTSRNNRDLLIGGALRRLYSNLLILTKAQVLILGLPCTLVMIILTTQM